MPGGFESHRPSQRGQGQAYSLTQPNPTQGELCVRKPYVSRLDRSLLLERL